MAKTNEKNPMSIVAYLWFVGAIVVLVQNPSDKFLKYHAWQSIFLSAVYAGFWIIWNLVVNSILLNSLGYGALGVWSLLGLVSTAISILFLVAWVMAVVKAYNGEMYKLPIIGDMAEKQAAK